MADNKRGVINRDTLDAIAYGIRFYAEETQKYSPTDMVVAIDRVYERGYVKGEAAAKGECELKHFAAVVTGDGTTELSFHLPFEPDTLCVTCHDPDLRVTQGIMTIVQLEPCAFGQIAGLYCITSGGGGAYTSGLSALAAISTRYTRDENGLVTLKNFSTATTPSIQGFFGDGIDYIVMATKVIGKTDKERITEALERLPSDPAAKYNIYISKAKKEDAFTDDEWNDLIDDDTVKQYTIVLI